MLKELEKQDNHFVAHKHRRSALKNLHDSVSSDGIHPTSDWGLKIYSQSVKDAVVLAVRRMKRLGYI